MSEASGGDLQFETAEAGEGHADPTACGYCGGSLSPSYWVVDDRPACARCKGLSATRGTWGSGPGRFARACLYGGLAGLLGAGIWYGLRELTGGYEFGLISIVVGWLVGAGVRIGSHGRGGKLYQALAVFIAYTAIASTYVPLIVRELRQQFEQSQDSDVAADGTTGEAAAPAGGSSPPDPEPDGDDAAAPGALPAEAPPTAGQALVALTLFAIAVMAIAYAAPFFGGVQSLLGLAIIGFGLWQAWHMNRRVDPVISGPFQIGAGAAGGRALTGIPGV